MESKATATIVSTKVKPGSLSLLAVLFALLFTPGSLLAQPEPTLESQLPKAVTTQFVLDPPSATIWRRTGEGHVVYLGRSNEKVTLGLNALEASGAREILVEFRVALWGTEWVSPAEFVSAQSLLADSRYPSQGSRNLGLSSFQRFQAWTRAHLAWSSMALLSGFSLIALLVHLLRRPASKDRGGFGDYQLGRRIGAGGMGEVYLATGSDGHSYALKLLRPLLQDKSELQELFDQELATGLALQHPGLTKLFGYGLTEDGRLYLVNELLEGQTLKARLGEPEPRRLELAVEVLEQVGSALDYLHSQNVIHQDVKPSNIFVLSDGTVKLLDLGLARTTEEARAQEEAVGTTLYMAPEQFSAQVSPSCDQYALGLVLYEILTGVQLGKGKPAATLAHWRSTQLPEPPSAHQPHLSEVVDSTILRMLNPRPDERFAKLQSVRDILTQELMP